MPSTCASGKQTEQDEAHFGSCDFYMHWEKEMEAKEEKMDVVIAKGK